MDAQGNGQLPKGTCIFRHPIPSVPQKVPKKLLLFPRHLNKIAASATGVCTQAIPKVLRTPFTQVQPLIQVISEPILFTNEAK